MSMISQSSIPTPEGDINASKEEGLDDLSIDEEEMEMIKDES